MEKKFQNSALKFRGTCVPLGNYFYKEVYVKYIPECCQGNTITIPWISAAFNLAGNSQDYILQGISDAIPFHIWKDPVTLQVKHLSTRLTSWTDLYTAFSDITFDRNQADGSEFCWMEA